MRDGSVAEIATVTTMAQTATNSAPQGVQTASGLDALFVALFQQALQTATPANDAGGTQAANANTPGAHDLIAQANLVQETAQDGATPGATNSDGSDPAAAPVQSEGDSTNAAAPPPSSSSPQSAVTASSEAMAQASADSASLTMDAAAQTATSPQPASDEEPQTAPNSETAPDATTAQTPGTPAAAQASVTPPSDEAAPQTSDADESSTDDSQATTQQASKPQQKNGSALTAVATWLTQFLAMAPASPQGGDAAAQPDTSTTTAGVAAAPAPALAEDQPADASAASDKDDRQGAGQKNDAAVAPTHGQASATQPSADGQNGAQPSPAHAPAVQSSANGQSAAQAASATAQAASSATQATASPPANSGTAATLHLVPQHDDTGTSLNTLGITIAAKSADGTKQFDIRLDPPELGRVEVRLSLDDSGKAQASLLVDKPETLALLRQDAPALGRALSDAGLNLSNNGLNFQLRDGQERQNDGGNTSRGRSRTLSVKAFSGVDAASSTASIPDLALDGARLDIRV
jgi:chemotaxis protein MotD